jgi:hypothetical protein
MLRHPWVTSISEGPSIGPSSVRHFDQSLQALATLDQPFRVKLDILNAVDEYVFGYCSQVGDEAVWDDARDVSPTSSSSSPRLVPAARGADRRARHRTAVAEVEEPFTDPDRFLRNVPPARRDRAQPARDACHDGAMSARRSSTSSAPSRRCASCTASRASWCGARRSPPRRRVPRRDRAAPLVLVGTSRPDGGCEVSPRGGPPGFVQVLDEQRLAIPDLSGNNLSTRSPTSSSTRTSGCCSCCPAATRRCASTAGRG